MSTTSRAPVTVLRRQLPLVAWTTAVVALLLVTLSIVLPRTWSSDVVLRLTPQTAELSLDPNGFNTPEDPARRLATETESTLSDAVVQPAAQQLGMDVDDLREDVQVMPSEDANVFLITASASSAERAQQVATAVSTQKVQVSLVQEQARLTRAAESLGPQLASAELLSGDPDASQAVRAAAAAQAESLTRRQAQLLAQRDIRQPSVEIVTAAREPLRPDGLSLPQAIVLGTVAGLLLGLALAFLRDLADSRLRDAQELSGALDGVPVLTVPPNRRSRRRGRVDPGRADAVGSLRLAVTQQLPTAVLVTGVTPEDDATSLLVDLGISLSRAGVATVLVDARTATDGVSALLGVADQPGLAQLAGIVGGVPHWSPAHRADLRDALRSTEENRLQVLPGGWSLAHESLHGPSLEALVAALLEDYQVVLVDGEGAASADGVVAARAVSAVVVATCTGRHGSRLPEVSQAAERFRLMGLRPRLGVALETSRRSARRPLRATVAVLPRRAAARPTPADAAGAADLQAWETETETGTEAGTGTGTEAGTGAGTGTGTETGTGTGAATDRSSYAVSSAPHLRAGLDGDDPADRRSTSLPPPVRSLPRE